MPRKPAPIVRTSGKDPDEKLTIKEVCQELKIGPSTFYDWRRKGQAPPCTRLPNGAVRVVRRDLDDWYTARGEVA